MKKIITNLAVYVILAAMFCALIPGITNRITHESENQNVVISLLYNDIRNKVSAQKLSTTLNEYKQAGITTISLMEDDINSMVAQGEVTSIKYNLLHHRFDKESIELADIVERTCPDISFDSHIVIARKEETKDKLRYMMPRKYSDDEYAFICTFEGMDVYTLYDGKKNLWDYSIGYDEEEIRTFKEMGFDVALIHKVKNYAKTDYLDDIDRIVKEYDIEYMNIKEDAYQYDPEDMNKENYIRLSEIVNKNDMTLVVTENVNQLSNQQCFGYSHIFNETMKEGGSNKVIRAYETYDDSHIDESFYKYRASQYLNSTVDRNIRFITVTQIVAKGKSMVECSDYTFQAAKLYKDTVENLGYTVNQQTNKQSYTANTKLNSAVCAVIMVLFVLLMWQMISEKKSFALTLSALILSAAAFAGTYILPDSLIALYPTVFSAIQSCFAMTAVMYFVKKTHTKLKTPLLIVGALAVMMVTLLAGAVGMGSLLSGIDYYINNLIFRGIKLSLIVPICYTAVVFYFMFIKNSDRRLIEDIKTVLNTNIKVYWVIIGCIILVIGVYYLIRSGNVNQISSLEQSMRNAITDIFPERPRTKEFLIGYPALILFVYYVKNTNCALMKWLLAIAASILAASVTNSFCHVFTDFSVIFTRTMNGLLLGVIVAIFAYVANYVLLSAIKFISRKLNQNTEMK